jgi:hypothetical protein
VIDRDRANKLVNQLVNLVEEKTQCQIAYNSIGHDVTMYDNTSLLDFIKETSEIIESIKQEIMEC